MVYPYMPTSNAFNTKSLYIPLEVYPHQPYHPEKEENLVINGTLIR
jgi:hypothetical protein